MTLVHYEDENTRYIDIGPVNKVINMLCCWFDNPDGQEFKRCAAFLPALCCKFVDASRPTLRMCTALA